MIDGAIPGAGELLGRGVYRGLPDKIPEAVRDRNAVVVGEPLECTTAARQLRRSGWSVTVVTRKRRGRGIGRNCRRRVRTELVCAAGAEYLEVVVLRRVDTGRIDALNVSALFIM